MTTGLVILLGIALLSLTAQKLYARFCPDGCEECGHWSSCLHCPYQGTPTCPIVRPRNLP